MIHRVFFSGKGTTDFCSEAVAKALCMPCVSYNWRKKGERKALEVDKADILLFAMPVYGGYIPSFCEVLAEELLQSNGAKAVIMAIYGNRHYDNALIQMRDILTSKGFLVVAAGAFIAEHSIYRTVASCRPDSSDIACLSDFAKKTATLLSSDFPSDSLIQLPGKKDWDSSEFKGVPFHPSGGYYCTGCGACASVCPMDAIDAAFPWRVDDSKCIACGACIVACPEKARGFNVVAWHDSVAAFEAKCAARRECEAFFLAK